MSFDVFNIHGPAAQAWWRRANDWRGWRR